jgi:hypothetical protein
MLSEKLKEPTGTEPTFFQEPSSIPLFSRPIATFWKRQIGAGFA